MDWPIIPHNSPKLHLRPGGGQPLEVHTYREVVRSWGTDEVLKEGATSAGVLTTEWDLATHGKAPQEECVESGWEEGSPSEYSITAISMQFNGQR